MPFAVRTLVALLLACCAGSVVGAQATLSPFDSARAELTLADSLGRSLPPSQYRRVVATYLHAAERFAEHRDSSGQARALLGGGIVLRAGTATLLGGPVKQADSDSATALMLRARDLFRKLPDHRGYEGYASEQLGTPRPVEPVFDPGNTVELRAHLHDALKIWESLGSLSSQARVVGEIGFLWFSRMDSAIAYSDSSLSLVRAARDTANEIWLLNTAGIVYARGIHAHGVSLASVVAARDTSAERGRRMLRLSVATGNVLGQFRALVSIPAQYRFDLNHGELFNADTIARYAALKTAYAYRNADRYPIWLFATALYNALDYRSIDLDSARSFAKDAVSFARQRADSNSILTSLYWLGTIERSMGWPDSAITHLAESVRYDPRGRSSMRVLALGSAGEVYMDRDMADSALTTFRRLVALTDISPDSRESYLALIGNVMSDLGQHDSATVYLRGAIDQSRARGNVPALRDNLLGFAAARLKERRAADDSTFSLLRESLSLAEAPLDWRAGRALGYLARAFRLSNQPDSALIYARQSQKVANARRDFLYEGTSIAEIGLAFGQRGQIDSAMSYLTGALDQMRRTGGIHGVRATLAAIAELLRSSNTQHLSVAIAYFDSAAAVVEIARRSAGADDNTIAFAEDQNDVFAGWARAWAGTAAANGAAAGAGLAALGAVERGRAHALQDMLSRLRSVERPAEATSCDHFESTLGADLAFYADSLLAPRRAAHQAALTYLHAGDTLFRWLATPDGTISLTRVPLLSRELAMLVRSARRSMGADEARSTELAPDELKPLSVADSVALAARNGAADLRRLAFLLLPRDLYIRVPKGMPIVIVPSGMIALVPFAALEPMPSRSGGRKAEQVLGARYPLHFAPSFAALREAELRPSTLSASGASTSRAVSFDRSMFAATTVVAKAGHSTRAATRKAAATRTRQLASALVVANPSMPFIYSGRWTTRSQLRSLPGAEAEGRAIARLLGATVLIGARATETAVRARLATAPLIHLATHGMAYGTASTARRSYVALSPDSTNDGLLTLGELMDDSTLVLHAELVVLSACQTGLGDLKQAEGTIGLQRAFLAKGARSVLVSLWNVDDEATRLLMKRFYVYWLSSTAPHTKAEALQLAQRDVRALSRFANPKYWAGFQLVGAD